MSHEGSGFRTARHLQSQSNKYHSAARTRARADAGVEMIAVACPTCMINLKHGANRLGAKIEIQDVTALLHRSVK